ncbi:hypothetical protein C8R42DRAFT_581801 [Lentinula raphanica]|nr:hypothetical protein C8R42DRAFT_581801 [Lentinula raphanica]
MSNFLCSVCKIRGKDQIYCTDHAQWMTRDVEELREWAWSYKNAQTLGERKHIFETHGVRWSSFWLLGYWDPTRMLVIDAMHCLLEGLVHYHCRHVLRLDASASKHTADDLKVAYEWPWVPDTYQAGSPQLQERHSSAVRKIQETLCLSLAGKKCLTLDQMWTRLHNQSKKSALESIIKGLGLSRKLENIDERLSSLYIARAVKTTKRRNKDQLEFPKGQEAATSHQLIVVLLNWRLRQPLSSDAYIIPTGTPGTLAHIQSVIRETSTPSWVNSVPKNFGEAKAGSLKADEWRTLSALYLPIALVTLWGDNDGIPPPVDETDAGHLFQALNHTMALFQATILACRYTMTASRARAYQEYIASWTQDLRRLFPHVREGIPRPNIHAAGHIYDFLLLFGPVLSWWCFPFERLIGVLQKVNTNDHRGGTSFSDDHEFHEA